MIFQNYALHMGRLSGGLLILSTKCEAEAGVATCCSVSLLNHKLLLNWHSVAGTAAKSTKNTSGSGDPFSEQIREHGSKNPVRDWKRF